MKNIDVKKALKITKYVVEWVVIVLAVMASVLAIISINASKVKGQSIFGYKLYVVTSDSMSKTDFDAGDVIISKSVDVNTIKEGDIITFVSNAIESYGKILTHKVRRVTMDVNGNRAFETYGTTTGKSDTALATEIVGKYVGKISNVGNVLAFLKTPTGYILCVFTPISIVIIFQAVNTFKLAKETEEKEDNK
ncbi:MAG: signal peptidase I [Clostridia bacterium]|nr:signal peptidase I [Clostridia bacterium]